MDGAIHTKPVHPLVRTGPIEQRDRGPNGRPLGTPEDCYGGSPWELHRGELVKTMSAHEIHSTAMLIVSTLFAVHSRESCMAFVDVYCILDDAQGESRRAPDVVLTHHIETLRGEPLRGIPILAVEICPTQSKRHLEEKVKLVHRARLAHDLDHPRGTA